jgi:diguanylate cyclase (GGDEF)-like protein
LRFGLVFFVLQMAKMLQIFMKITETVKILLLGEPAEKIRGWQEMLRPISECIWLDPTDIPADEQPEVVIADNNPIYEGDGGVIRIGGDSSADVNLPADTNAEQLRLACRLLAEIVRLRRRERAIIELQNRFYTEALTDHLTGLPNHRAWDETLPKYLAAVSESCCLCLAEFDLDFFKQINDDFGHVIGDEVLKSVGSAICENLRHGDFVARIGGDEFGLLIWVSDFASAQAVVERVRSALPDILKKLGSHPVTASAGLIVVDHISSPTTPKALFSCADEALRLAKQQGRNRSVLSEG